MEKFGRYEIISELGHGGMAQVFHAHDPDFDREVAVKVLPRVFLHDDKFRARFRREARMVAALEHPAIVPVYDIGEEDEQPYLVMRFMRGGSLSDRLDEGPLSISEVMRIVGQIAPGLGKAHDHGFIHRDLKPDNILFDGDGNAYIADFGIARLMDDASRLTDTNSLLGTPAYMSPEQVHGDEDLDARSDLYSLGVIVFEMLAGRLPFQSDLPLGYFTAHLNEPIPNILDINYRLPLGVQRVMETALAKNPFDRYPTAVALNDSLAQALAGHYEPTLIASKEPEPAEIPTVEATYVEPQLPIAGPESPATLPFDMEETPPRARRRAPWLLLGGAAAFLLLAAAAIVFVVLILPLLEGSQPMVGGLEINAEVAALAEAGVTGSGEWMDNDWWPYTLEINGAEMALVPAGCFEMGSEIGEADEMPVHEVCFDRPFWIDVYEVTNGQFGGPDDACTAWSSDDEQPRVCVTWDDAQRHCEARRARLLSEAEWEYAARGPSSRAYPWGNGFITTHAVYKANSDGETAPVGSRPNGDSWVGAYDLSGNVWEWVSDGYDAGFYATLADGVVNPHGPDEGDRVLRGGAWGYEAEYMRSAARNSADPSVESSSYGFRCGRDY